jgi:plastocyanin
MRRTLVVLSMMVVLGACDGYSTETSPKAGGPLPPTFSSVTIEPSSLTLAIGASRQLAATARDQNGTVMTGLGDATFTSLNTSVVTVSSTGFVIGIATGTTTVTASITSGGVTRSGNASVTVGSAPPATATVQMVGTSFNPGVVSVQQNGSVTWTNTAGVAHNVTFSAAQAPLVNGGNIPDHTSGSNTRSFPTAGTYGYACTIHSGMSGTVVVQ